MQGQFLNISRKFNVLEKKSKDKNTRNLYSGKNKFNKVSTQN
jgi:hypothetical protein